MTLVVQYRFRTRREFIERIASDLSRGGMFIRTETPCQLKQVVCLQFELEDGEKLIEGLGRVVHVNQSTISASPSGMGIEFIDLDDASTRLIEEIVSTRLTEIAR